MGIARQIADGTLDLRRIARSDDPTAHRHLVNIRSIGPWTADLYLLMALGRLAQRWAPWRAVAAHILWHHYLSTRGGSPVQE